jgi:hypothetical protein
MPASSMILVSEANEEAAKAARVKAIYESQARPLPKPKKRLVHGRPTTMDIAVADGTLAGKVAAVRALSGRLERVMADLNLAYMEKDGKVRNTALTRHGWTTMQCADDAIVLAYSLAEALAVAFPRKAVSSEPDA